MGAHSEMRRESLLSVCFRVFACVALSLGLLPLVPASTAYADESKPREIIGLYDNASLSGTAQDEIILDSASKEEQVYYIGIEKRSGDVIDNHFGPDPDTKIWGLEKEGLNICDDNAAGGDVDYRFPYLSYNSELLSESDAVRVWSYYSEDPDDNDVWDYEKMYAADDPVTVDGTEYWVFPVGFTREEGCGVANVKLYLFDAVQWAEWSKTSSELGNSVEITVTVLPQIPTPADLVYDGTLQTPFINTSGFTVAEDGGSAVDAGDYVATVTPEQGLTWYEDGTLEPKEVGWSIAKRTLEVSLSSVTIKQGEDVSADAIEMSISGFANGEDETTLEGFAYPEIDLSQVDNTTEGTYAITLKEGTGNATGNYAFELVNPGEVVVTNADPIDVPSAEGASFTYDGQPHAFPVDESAAYSIAYKDAEGNVIDGVPVDAGTYSVVATPKAGYRWSEDIDPLGERVVTDSWVINKVRLTVSYEEVVEWYETPLYEESEGFVVEGFIEGEDETNAADYVSPTLTSGAALGRNAGWLDRKGRARNYYFIYLSSDGREGDGTAVATPVGVLIVKEKPLVSLAPESDAAAKLSSCVAGAEQPIGVELAYEGNPAATQADVTCTTSDAAVAEAAYDLASGMLTVTPKAEGACIVTVSVRGDSTGLYEAVTYQAVVVVKAAEPSDPDDPDDPDDPNGPDDPSNSDDPDNPNNPSNPDDSNDPSIGGVSATVDLLVGNTLACNLTYDGSGTLSATSSSPALVTAEVKRTASGAYQLVVNAVAEGTALVTITDENGGADPQTMEVRVRAATNPGDEQPVSLGSLSVPERRSVSNTPKVKDAEGNEATLAGYGVKVASSDETVATATCDANGKLTITGVKPGSAQLTLTSDKLERSYTIDVTVTKQPAASYADADNTGVAIEVSALALPGEYASGSVRLASVAVKSGAAYDLLKTAAEGNVLGVWEVDLFATPPEGEEVQIHNDFGTLNIAFPVDAAYEGKEVIVRHMHEGGNITAEKATVKGGKVTITVSDLSTFSVEDSASQGSANPGDKLETSTNGSSTGSTAGAGLSKTGDAFTYVMWASSAVIAVALASVAVMWRARRRCPSGECDASQRMSR